MSNDTRFAKLIEPSYIGKVKIRNRIIKTGQGTSFIETTGYVGEQARAYYETMAKGGVGLLIVESCGVEYPLGVHHPPVQFHLDDDKYIPSYSELTQAVHKHGCPIFLQIFHAGPWNPTGLLPKRDTKTASALAESELPGPGFAVPRGMTHDEVKEYINMFARAAERAHKAGFDGVEINGATCHLINTFFSRIFNKRDDEYGCATLENRARFMCDVVREIKKRLGRDFPVIALINVAEYGHEKATTVEEGVQFAKFMPDAGADAVQVRAHGYGHRGGLLHPDRLFYPEPPKSLPKDLDWSRKGVGAILPLIEAVKRVVSVPVFGACRFDPVLGEELLREGKLDFVGMTRRLLADPELPNKVAAGRLEDITPCLGCLYCMDVRLHNNPIRCRVNAKLGREREYTFEPAERKKKVVVFGGGPAGMEAARVAAIRGHQVTLCGSEPKVGGLLPLAAMLKDVEIDDILTFVRYLGTQMNKLGVTVRLETGASASVVEELKPDAVILATGGKHAAVEIPGASRRIVVNSAALHRKLKSYLRFLGPKMLARLTKLWMPIGKRVVVIGGAIHGCELAEFLIKRGREVTIVDTAEALGEGMTGDDKFQLFRWLDEKGITRYLGVKYEEITDEGLVITTREGERKILGADTILTALPLRQDAGVSKSLEGKAPEVYAIGDCREPGLIADAVADGARIGHSV